MTDPTREINEAFDQARDREREERDQTIDADIDTTERIAKEFVERTRRE